MSIKEHLNYAIVPEAHTPMYLIHKYWARKPHNVVSEYIKKYSKENDIVLDPFSGSGPTPIEAIKLQRKGIGIDLDPVATFITKMTAIPIETSKIQEEFDIIEKECKIIIEKLYKTICPKCKKEVDIVYVIKENEKMIEIGYHCQECLYVKKTRKRFLIKKPDENDFNLLKKIDEMKIPYWYPTKRLAYNGKEFKEGTHLHEIDSVDKLFDKRALISLSILYHYIENIKNDKLKEIFKIIFTSNVHNVSKLNTVHQPRWKTGQHPSTSWILHRYWIPSLRVECPVWFYFKERVNHIIDAKNDSNSQLSNYKEGKSFQDLKNGNFNFFIKTFNAIELTKLIPRDSVDYIFTDPPYGGAIQYFELSTLWASWLKMELNYSEEITINDNQEKDFLFYHKMLKSAFREMYIVLKPGKFLTVTFHSTDIKVWNSIIKAVVMSGFDIEKIIYQPPARPSAKGLFQPYGSAVGDYYIRFRKPDNEKLSTDREMDNERYEREVVFAAKGILEHRGEPTIYQHILNGIMVDLKGGRYAPINARNVEEILKDHVKIEFELIDMRNEKGKIIGKKWWLKNKDFSNFSTPALSDRVERAVISVLDKKVKAHFDDILQSIFIDFPNALTPESETIKGILQEYAKPTSDGKWMLKPGMDEKTRESIHSKMIYILAILGKKANYDIWIGLREQSTTYNKELLSKYCDDIRIFKHISQEEIILKRIKQIDVLWLEDGKIKYEFEVENTTGISEAIIRGSNIPSSLNPKRYIVIPKERESFLFRKLQEPILKETIKKVKWNFIIYDDLERLFNEKKKQFTVVKLEQLAKMPSIKKSRQKHLSEYEDTKTQTPDG